MPRFVLPVRSGPEHPDGPPDAKRNDQQHTRDDVETIPINQQSDDPGDGRATYVGGGDLVADHS